MDYAFLVEARVDNVLSRDESNKLLSLTYSMFCSSSILFIWYGCSLFFKDMILLNLHMTNQRKSLMGQSPQMGLQLPTLVVGNGWSKSSRAAIFHRGDLA